MSKSSEIRTIIRHLLSDGADCSVEDVWNECVKQAVISPKERSIVRAALYYMKQRGEITALPTGKYQACRDMKEPGTEQLRICALDLAELQEFDRRIEQTCQELRHFNWIMCSDSELEQAREKVFLLRQIRDRLQALDIQKEKRDRSL